MMKISWLLATTALAAVVGAPPPALAQSNEQASPEPASALEEVVVTARRRSERLQEVPVAVTAFSAEALSERPIFNATDLNAYVPSMRIEGMNSPDKLVVGIRGQRNAQVLPGQDNSVSFYMGEVPIGIPYGVNQQFYDLGSVEVLKGPQGTLFGQSTTGGAILIGPKRPVHDYEASVVAGVRAFDGGEGAYGNLVLNAPVGETLALRAAFNWIDRDGYVANNAAPGLPTGAGVPTSNGERVSDERTSGARLSALWTPSASFDSYFLYEATRFRSNGAGFHVLSYNPASFTGFFFPEAEAQFGALQAEYADNFWSTRSGTRSSVRLDMQRISNTSTYRPNDSITIKNIIAYRDFDRYNIQELTGFDLPILTAELPDSGTEFSEELQFQGTAMGGDLDWVVGLSYFDQKIQHGSSTSIFGAPLGHEVQQIHSRSYAVFGQGTLKLSGIDDRLSVTLGARYTVDKREVYIDGIDGNSGDCVLSDDGAPLPVSECFFDNSADFREPTYTASVNFQLDEGTLLYAATRRGYRAGGFAPDIQTVQSNRRFDPEIVTDYELGFKKDWRIGEMLLRTNGAVYYQDYVDIQRFVAIENPTDVAVFNAAGAEIPGAEFDVLLVPTPGLNLSASVSIIKPKYTDFHTAQGDFTHNRLAQVPESQFTLGVHYDLPVPSSLGEMRVGADYYHQGEVYFTDTTQGAAFGPDASQKQDAYGLLNFRADWDRINNTNVGASFYIQNALAEEYHTYGIILYPSLGYNAATVGDPRVFGFELRYSW